MDIIPKPIETYISTRLAALETLSRETAALATMDLEELIRLSQWDSKEGKTSHEMGGTLARPKADLEARVNEWNSKAKVVSNLLRRIANTQCGPPPYATRKTVKACIEPMLLCGSEAWYPGRDIGGKPSRSQHLLDRTHKTYASSLRATAPTWKTTPLPALYRESGFPPIDILIESHRRRFAARLQSLNSAHPLVQHLKPPDRGRATRLPALLPQAPRPLLQPRIPPVSPRLPDERCWEPQRGSFEPLDLPPTLAFIRRQARTMSRDEFSSWWTNNMPEASIPLDLKADLRGPKELTLPRSTLHHLLAARTHHGDFATYHERFNHLESTNNCSCDHRKNAYHIFYYRKVASANDYGWDRRCCGRSTRQQEPTFMTSQS
ncbi:reverse transcriptase [Fusarium albosuccineum]|uniref:Reverse transcriptase n=1 Tax=Fusarium albosuccineum TaxID=1237068 RepID=A0A8H4LEC2_9HYPO|nr:reverse transcriptase [Fusarium albosuccineum]